MSVHICHKCGKQGEVKWSHGERHPFQATCNLDNCPAVISVARWESLFNSIPVCKNQKEVTK